LVLTLVPGIGREVNGSKRWINLLGFSFQPSEFVKIIVPAFFIHEYLKQSEVSLKVFLKLLARSGLPIFLIMIEPNNGTASVIALTLIVAFWLVEVPFKYWAFPLLAACLVGGVFASQLPYVQKRIKVYLNPESDLKGKGHQPYQAKIAAGSGGLYGKGPAKSLQKLSYLPEAQNDYIAAIFAEEFGFLGILALITLYMALLLAGYIIAVQSGTKAGFALGGSIIFLITFQGFLNLGVVSGLLPSTGLNLPLFSQGGTSLMANFVWIALLYDIGGACAAVQKS
jgi:cell division protein FtsW